MTINLQGQNIKNGLGKRVLSVGFINCFKSKEQPVPTPNPTTNTVVGNKAYMVTEEQYYEIPEKKRKYIPPTL